MRPTQGFALYLALAAGLSAQPIIETIAGGYVPDGVPGLSVAVGSPSAVATDASGNLYIASSHYHTVFRLNRSGELKVVAGSGSAGFSGDGDTATMAALYAPSGLALDGVGNMYIADSGNNRIRRVILSTGVIETVAGNGSYGFSGDGRPATSASLRYPRGVAVDSAGNLFIADWGNQRIRWVVSSTGVIDTVAGNGSKGFSGDGQAATSASLADPTNLVADSFGGIYIADTGNHRIRRLVMLTGVIDTVAGNGDAVYSGDGGPATSAGIAFPWSLALDLVGNLYIGQNYRVRRVTLSTGLIDTAAGNGQYGTGGDGGPATSASIGAAEGLAADGRGDLYIADRPFNRIRRVMLSRGVIETAAGNGAQAFGGDGGPATSAILQLPGGVAVIAPENLYIADGGNRRIRRLALTTGLIDTVAGSAISGYSGDWGAATRAGLVSPRGVAADASGNLYIADRGDHRIRRVALSTGVIDTVAGNGRYGYSGDGGAATSASLANPESVTVDAAGNLYISDSANHRIRRVVLSTGIINTVAGTGSPGFSGDGGAATSAGLFDPFGVAVDTTGNLYIADRGNRRVRRVVLSTGVMNTVAGNGPPGYCGDNGAATNACMWSPSGLAVDHSGNLYIADSGNNHVRRVVLSTGVIDTVAGNGQRGFSGDGGAAASASLANPESVAVDGFGSLYISDRDNQRIRRVTGLAAPPTRLSLSTSQLSFSAAAGSGVTSGQTVQVSSTPAGASFTAAASVNWLRVSPTSGTLPSTLTVTADASGLVVGTYSTSIRIISPGAATVTVEVTLTATAASAPALSASPASVSFNTSARASQTVSISSSGAALAFSARASGGAWLSVSPTSSTTPASVTITADPAGLSPGNYSGSITISATGASNSPLTIPVTLTVPATASLVILQTGLSFNYQVNSVLPPPQDVVVATTGGQIEYRVAVAVAQPPGGRWLSASLASGTAPGLFKVNVNPSGLPIGSYEGTVTISAQGGSSTSLPVRLVVSDPIPSGLDSDVEFLSYSYAFAASPETRQVSLTNPSFNPLRFAAEATVEAGSGWLRVSSALGDVSATNPVTLVVIADPKGMDAGTYTGTVRIRSVYTDQVVTIPVTMTVSRNTRRLQLSQTGLAFTAVAGSGDDAPQDFGVLNTGQGAMSWTAVVRLPEGAPGWLAVDKSSGTSVADGEIPMIRVSTRAAGLAPGEYQGEIVVSAEGADNSPHPVTVILRVRPPGSDPGPSLIPSGLIFTATSGGVSPAEQSVLVLNRGGRDVTAVSSSLTFDGRPWLSYSPTTLRFAGTSVTRAVFAVRVNTAGLAAGIYEGRITVSFPGGVNRVLNVLLVVAQGSGRTIGRAAEAACTPTRYVPLFTSLEDQFTVTAGAPSTTEMLIADDCGNPVTEASVGASFTNRDRSLRLIPLKRDGRWSATWLPANSRQSGVTVNVTATDVKGERAGSVPSNGYIRDATTGPMIDRTRPVVDAASLQPGRPLAPGSMVVINGERLASAGGGVTVSAGEFPLAVRWASDKRIEAVVPPNIGANASYQLTVRRDGSVSLPEEVVVAEAAPAVFTADRTGRGQGEIYVLPEGSDPVLAAPKTPATAGDRVILVCTGLGVLNPPASQVRVTMGGAAAEAVRAEPQSDQPGSYLVWATVPGGIQPGDAVPVRVTVAGQSSPAVTMAVR